MNNKLLIIVLFLIASLTFAQDVKISDPWIRPAGEESNTGLFFVVQNNSDKSDTLYKAVSGLSEVVELHETYKKSDDMMGMRKVPFVVIPPKSAVHFKPRDLHIMLIGLKKDLTVGTHGKVSLHFRKAGEVKLNAVVRDMPKMK
jgi:periplasmic copper chaperone A